MVEDNKYTKATWRIMTQLLEADALDDALAGSLEMLLLIVV